MLKCDVCKNESFEKFDGYMYCTECNTQSQEYIEQEFEFHGTSFIKNRPSKKVNKSPKNNTTVIEGTWTSWEAFNYILYGMTKELTDCFPLPSEFQSLVLKLWAAYLKACNVAFTSKYNETKPKLQVNFKKRDAQVLFNMQFKEQPLKKKKKTQNKNFSSSPLKSSVSSRAISRKKRKIIADDYEAHLSQSMVSQQTLENETLESLGKSNLVDEDDDIKNMSQSNKKHKKLLKQVLDDDEYVLYKKSLKSNKDKVNAKSQAKNNIKSLGKNKLLSILHLALLMSKSKIQLCDLFRLIRESHLSFAKVTHFLPENYKFSKTDVGYIEIVSDNSMPTHFKQRYLTSKIANLIGIKEINSPNMSSLVQRYCKDLNLPAKISKLSKIIVERFVPKIFEPKSSTSVPSFEACAIASILFIMKLLFGLNDKTEIFLSDLAENINGTVTTSNPKVLFVFQKWQKFIECRKVLLKEHHYPTHEQLENGDLTSSKKFLHTLYKESKDDFREARFIPYKKYYMDSELISNIKSMLSELLEPIEIDSANFQPSLTPQSSHLDAIISYLKSKCDYEEELGDSEKILRESFKSCKIDFTFNPSNYVKILEEENFESINKLRFYDDFVNKGNDNKMENGSKTILNATYNYWIYHDVDIKRISHCDFEEHFLTFIPKNFQWLTIECARMIEMKIRDVYGELVTLEKHFIKNN